MADLNPLIRVRRHAIEQKQKFLAGLYREAEELQQQKQKLQEEMAAERKALEDMKSAESAASFGRYAEAVRNKIKKIDEATAKLEVRIKIAQDDMRDAFAELKKIEITQERREEKEAAEILKKESAELDEIGIETHRRKSEEA